MFTGDPLFCGGPAATGRSFSDKPTVLNSIRAKLLTLHGDTVVHTGYGDDTTIAAELSPLSEPRNLHALLRPTKSWRGLGGDMHLLCIQYGPQWQSSFIDGHRVIAV